MQVAAAEPKWCGNCGNVESVRAIKQRAEGSGIGAAGGAIVGGLVLGLALSYVSGYIERGSALVNVAALVILMVVLLVRPGGIFASSTARRA